MCLSRSSSNESREGAVGAKKLPSDGGVCSVSHARLQQDAEVRRKVKISVSARVVRSLRYAVLTFVARSAFSDPASCYRVQSTFWEYRLLDNCSNLSLPYRVRHCFEFSQTWLVSRFPAFTGPPDVIIYSQYTTDTSRYIKHWIKFAWIEIIYNVYIIYCSQPMFVLASLSST